MEERLFRVPGAARAAAAPLAALLAALLAGCTRGDVAAPDAAAMTLPDGNPAVILSERPESWPHDPYTFRGMSRSGDRLRVEIEHGGGCARHEFALVVVPVMLESEPVQMHGVLAHEDGDDPCRALIRRTLEFDLSPLKVAWRRSYRQQSGTLVLHVDGWPEPVRYSF
jgi:hypothetical protein